LIKIIAKSESGEILEVSLNKGESALVGRSKGCDLVLPGKSVSRKHLTFTLDEYGDVQFEKISRFAKAIYEGGDHPGGTIKPGEKIIIGDYEISIEDTDGNSETSTGAVAQEESLNDESGFLNSDLNESEVNEEFSDALSEESEVHSQFLESHDPNNLDTSEDEEGSQFLNEQDGMDSEDSQGSDGDNSEDDEFGSIQMEGSDVLSSED
jgi:hypothetical protein